MGYYSTTSGGKGPHRPGPIELGVRAGKWDWSSLWSLSARLRALLVAVYRSGSPLQLYTQATLLGRYHITSGLVHSRAVSSHWPTCRDLQPRLGRSLMRLVLPADAPGVEVVHRHRAILAPSCTDNGYDHQNGRLHHVYAQVK